MDTAERNEEWCTASRIRRFRPLLSRHFYARGFFLKTFAALALALIVAATSFAQNDYDSLYDRACLSFKQANYDDALKFYKKANRLKEDSDPECLWGMAQTYSRLGAYKNTLKTCDLLIEASGDNLYYAVKAWNMRGNELSAAATEKPGEIDQEKLQQAEAAFREVLRLSGAAMAHYNLGITLIRLNRIDEGARELQIYARDADNEELAEKARRIIREPRRAVENFAPDFTFVTSEGEYVDSIDLKGRILLVDFWGAWCKPCRDAVPFLSRVAKKYGEEAFVLISVDENDQESKWREFIAENRMNWTHTRDGDRKIQNLFQINAFPTYILIDHEGIIRYRGIGSSPLIEDEVSSAIKQALKAEAAFRKQKKDAPGEQASKLTENSPRETLSRAAQVNLSAEASRSARVLPPEEGKRVFSFRFPKPSVEVTRAEPPNLAPGIQGQMAFYRLSVSNWASLPDDLFETAKGLAACSNGSIGSGPNTIPRRLEIIVKSEEGALLRSFCDPPQPQILSSLMFTVPIQSRPEKIYLTLKDRLTGKSVRSELVSLP